MPYFAMQYQILFHDTMVYGTHHHMVNLKFQNIARETLLFEGKAKGKGGWEEQLKDLAILTRDAYSLNLMPVNLGEKVAIILTFEEPTRSTVRLCFRVIKFDGQPVSCGYQTMLLMHKDTHELMPAPPLISQHLEAQSEKSLLEKLTNPSFAERVSTGVKGIKDIFTDEIISLGKYIANAPRTRAYPKIIDEFLNEFSIGDEEDYLSESIKVEANPSEFNKVVFTFPGQGAYNQAILKELYTSFPQTVPYFHRANEIVLRFLEHEFLPLITASSQEVHDRLLNACPDLDQIGIYLAEVLIARLLMQDGVKPNLLVGHSLGEMAALTVSGAFTIETGLKIVCQRVIALQSLNIVGKMAAVSCTPERLKEIMDKHGFTSIEISVINFPLQTVISGEPSELKKLGKYLAQLGITLTVLKSRYPFHSSFLRGAVKPFKINLNCYNFLSAQIPVYLCTEKKLYSADQDLAEVLSSQFIKTLDFKSVVNSVYESGYRNFIECGPGDIVSKIISKNLTDKTEVITRPVAPQNKDVSKGLEEITNFCLEKGISISSEKSEGQSQLDRQRFMSPQQESIQALVQDISNYLDPDLHYHQQAQAPSQTILTKDSQFVGEIIPTDMKETVSPEKRTALRTDIDKRTDSKFESKKLRSEQFPQENGTMPMPIAIVSMGCVLPGANGPEEYWHNIKAGVSGIINLAEIDPDASSDFVSGNVIGELNIVPDKTYTLLNGTILNIAYEEKLLSSIYSEDDFEQLTRSQRLLALAITQSLTALKSEIDSVKESKIQCILGATADGTNEYDDALFYESMQAILGKLDEPENLRHSFSQILKDISGNNGRDSEKLAQYNIYKDVVQKVFSRSIKTYILDSACSSSLYSINLGIKSLQTFESDLVFAGGVFAPGPANNTLFAQFRGLTPTASRPFDAAADGVIFADGSGIVTLKRLPDAMADGDYIWGVIRGMGLSSDGKSPSVNVPQLKGQTLAIRRAYASSKIDIDTLQYVETHTTATPVGDLVELNALKEATQNRDPNLPPIELGSAKALIGHTGWVSGVASVIKLCKAFEEKLIPKQYNYNSPSPEFNLEQSRFAIATDSRNWPSNIDAFPRRAGISSFGFGGTNTHLILEVFDEAYHQSLCKNLKVDKSQPETLAVVGVASLFPAADKLESSMPTSQLRFQRGALRLPAKKILLPDVVEHMDASQYLAALAADQIFSTMPDNWQELKDEIGVVLGLEGKTERGIQANERIFLDRLKRLFTKADGNDSISRSDRNRILKKIIDTIKNKNMPSGPYTLPGLMPNVVSGRIASLFDLKGPNVVIDMERNSLFQSLLVAEQFLIHKDCKIVLAGGLNAFNGHNGTANAEAAFILALTTLETARDAGFPIQGLLRISQLDKRNDGVHEIQEVNSTFNYKGANGSPEILKAINQIRGNNSSYFIKELENDSLPAKMFVFSPASESKKTSSSESSLPDEISKAYAYVQGTPIYYATPSLLPSDVEGAAKPLNECHILFLTDQPDKWSVLEKSGALDSLQYSVVCPAGGSLTNSVEIDLSSDESIQNTIEALNQVSYDTVIAVKNLKDYSEKTLLLNDLRNERTLLDLLFVICRHAYRRIQNKEISIITVCLNAYNGRQLDPYTGLVSGFMKSLRRELPDSVFKIISTNEGNFYKALRQVEIELGNRDDAAEASYLDGKRSVFKLIPISKLAKEDNSYLNSDSIVIATGGGRGVTAVLIEELLRCFSCTVIALGRTDPSSAPEHILNMDESAFQRYERQFYKDELAKGKTKKITELKRQYLSYQAANELNQVIKRLQALPGRFLYSRVDINDENAVNGFVKSVYEEYGRLDFVLHGAGIQDSRVLTKKSLNDFRNIISTKLGSLGYIYRACKKYNRNKPAHFHILTSTFSYMGNDGQPDYGAANEAMNRIAASMNNLDDMTHWSSMAWLGWAGIGMTRSSEFAALAANRRLRGITKEEGQKIFSSLMNGTPTTPINILMADGEIDYYKVAIETAPPESSAQRQSTKEPRKDFHVVQWDIRTENAPYLLDHMVNGIPTLPAAFITCIVAETAQQLRPELKVTVFENTHFHRFVRVYENRGVQLRVNAQVVSENEKEAAIQIHVLSDFIHKSGAILQKDILHNETVVRLSGEEISPPHKQFGSNQLDGLHLPDPYGMKGSLLHLKGQFSSMDNIIVGENHRQADYKLVESVHPESKYQYLTPNLVLVDAFWRFGTINVSSERTLPVYVPEKCEIMKMYYDFTDFDLAKLKEKLRFRGMNPRVEGDLLHVGPIEVSDPEGNVMLIVEGGVCRKFGEIKNAF